MIAIVCVLKISNLGNDNVIKWSICAAAINQSYYFGRVFEECSTAFAWVHHFHQSPTHSVGLSQYKNRIVYKDRPINWIVHNTYFYSIQEDVRVRLGILAALKCQ